MGIAESASTGFNIYQFVKYGMTSVFITIFFINAIMIGMQTKDPMQTLFTVGQELVFVTHEIHVQSLEIINNGMYQPDDNFFSGIWKCISTNAVFFYYIYMCFLWIKLLMFLYGWSPLSNDSNKFINLVLAVITFFLIQSVFNLIWMEPLENQNRLDLALSPFVCFYDFARAIPIIFSELPLSLKDMTYARIDEPAINTSSSGIVVM